MGETSDPMTLRPFLLLGLLCLAPLAAPVAQAASTDLLGCVFSPIDVSAFCEVGFGPSCTSTSACIGVDVSEIGKYKQCTIAGCTPWLPNCVGVTVWFQDWPDQPTFKHWGCLIGEIVQVLGPS